MCRINIEIANITIPENTTLVETVQGGYRLDTPVPGAWTTFETTIANPQTPVITTEGDYQLRIAISCQRFDGSIISSDFITSTFSIASECGDIGDVPTPTGCRRYRITNEGSVTASFPLQLLTCADPETGLGGLGDDLELTPGTDTVICATLAGSGITLGINQGTIINGNGSSFLMQDINQTCG